MDTLTAIAAIDSDIALITRQIADLDDKMRRWMEAKALLTASIPAPTVYRANPATTRGSGIPPQWAMIVEITAEHGGGIQNSNLKALFQRKRDKPIADGSFQALMSKIKSAGLVHKRDGLWKAGPERVEPETDLLATPGSPVQPNQEGGDAHAAITAN